jgi:hypothetical protein
MEQVIEIHELMHTSSKIKKEKIVYPIPNQLNFKVTTLRKGADFERKKHYMSVILSSIYTRGVHKKVQENQLTSVKKLKNLLEEINLKQFLFFRKVTEFIEDAFEKLPEDAGGEVNLTLRRLMGILRLFISCEAGEKMNEVRNQMGKSELIFPILNYF